MFAKLRVILLSGFCSILVMACGGGNSASTNNSPISVTKLSNKTMTSFSIVAPHAEGIINDQSKIITVNITEAADVTRLVARFSTNGVSVKIGEVLQTSGLSVNDFSRPVSYSVAAEDGSTQTYRVEVIVIAKSKTKSITAFSFPEYQVNGVIDVGQKLITATLPANAPLSSLKAHFETNGINVSVNGIKQVSGSTSNDFSKLVNLLVTAEDGSSQLYNVLISKIILSAAKEMRSFSIPSLGTTGVIDHDQSTISIIVPLGTDLRSLSPQFVYSGKIVSVNNVPQLSDKSVQDFSDAVQYTVIAENGSSRIYTISVSNPTSITLQSDGGDYIGGGASYSYSKSNAILSFGSSNGGLTISVNGDQDWRSDLVLPTGNNKLVVGTFNGLTRFPFNTANTGGFNWSGEGRGCNNLNANVVIKNVKYVDTTLVYLDLRFDQFCENGSSALHGKIVYNKYDDSKPPGPLSSVPANLWKPAQGKTPSTGNYVFLQSDSGDYIGGGKEYLYSGGTDPIRVTVGRSISISVGGWDGNFVPMNFLNEMQLGYYSNLSRYPFHNPMKGGLSWTGNGRGCNSLSGWFVVDRLSFLEGSLEELELRFGQHCEGGNSALKGKIYWSAKNPKASSSTILSVQEQLMLSQKRALFERKSLDH